MFFSVNKKCLPNIGLTSFGPVSMLIILLTLSKNLSRENKRNFFCVCKKNIMLSETCAKQHLIILPPPKSALFGGGSIFWIISWIFGSEPTKQFCWEFRTSRNFWYAYRPIPANPSRFVIFWNLKKLGLSVFLGKFGNFFVQNAILSKIGPRTIKNGFSEIV